MGAVAPADYRFRRPDSESVRVPLQCARRPPAPSCVLRLGCWTRTLAGPLLRGAPSAGADPRPAQRCSCPERALVGR